MSHEYTILTGGVVLAAADGCAAPTAIAWALDTILAVGADDEVLAISRGDSRVAALGGAIIAPARGGATLEPGGAADFLVLDGTTRAVLAEVRAGRLVSGVIHGLVPDAHADHGEP